MDEQSFLVIGGAGRIGRHVVDRLLAAGHPVTAASRHPSHTASGAATAVVDLVQGFDQELLEGVRGVVVAVEPPYDQPGAEALLHRGVARVAEAAGKAGVQVVLVSQIYVTRAASHPDMSWVIPARVAGEEAVRSCGAPYTIIRPSWLTDQPEQGSSLEQGDSGDGRISREAVASAIVAALFSTAARGKTFELYDTPGTPRSDWPSAFAGLASDASGHTLEPPKAQ